MIVFEYEKVKKRYKYIPFSILIGVLVVEIHM